MRQRAVGAKSIRLCCSHDTQDPGWMSAELVLAISSSVGHLSARPLVTLRSGTGSSILTQLGTDVKYDVPLAFVCVFPAHAHKMPAAVMQGKAVCVH